MRVVQSGGAQPWSQPPAAIETTTDPNVAELSIGAEAKAPCRWHPATLWIGVGCERNTSLSLVQRAIATELSRAGLAGEAVAGLASAERKADETALLDLSASNDWPFRTFTAEDLAAVNVPTPSEVVRAEMGTASVAEAAALLAAGTGGMLQTSKAIHHAAAGEQGAVTVAIAEAPTPFAPKRGELHLLGSGPGDLALLSGDARQALARCSAWVGYSLYLDLLSRCARCTSVASTVNPPASGTAAQALSLAQQGARVALISSGDSGIYGMAGLALELWLQQGDAARPSFQVHPGISAVQLAAARAGAPLMHDFCTVSLSDRLTPWPVIEQRLQAATTGDFVVGLYNPRSKGATATGQGPGVPAGAS